MHQTELWTAELPPVEEMYHAVEERDSRYDGVFFTAVRTTGIFCRPSCRAKTPGRENVTFYGSTRAALLAGYRPCQRCRPLELSGTAPPWLRPLLQELEADPQRRWRDGDLRALGVDPVRVRRWFKAQHGLTFHAYQRARRLGMALGHLRNGGAVTEAAFAHGYESLSGFHQAFRQLTGTTPGRNPGGVMVTLGRILTPLGPMLAGATDDALCLLEFVDRRMLETQLRRVQRRLNATFVPGESAVIERTADQLRRYFEGSLQAFDLPLLTPGTDFQQKVWTGLRAIPYGETRSYSQQAERLGAPSAVRAVARANGDNRIAIVIPCHRVVGKDGRLSGYGGGVWRKRRLLEHEARNARG